MQLEVKTLEVLKNFSDINQSLIVKKGNVLRTIRHGKSLTASAVIPQSFERDFAVYDLKKFINVISLFKNPKADIEFQDSRMIIRAGKQKISYGYCDPDNIEDHPPSEQLLIDKVLSKGEVAMFTLPAETISQSIKVAATLSNPQIAFVGKEGKLMLESLNVDMSLFDNYSVEIGETPFAFKAVFEIVNLNYLALNDYNIRVLNCGSAVFEGNDYQYVMMMNSKHSTFSKT